MQTDYTALIKEQRHYIEKILFHDKLRFPRLLFSAKLRNIKKQYRQIQGANTDVFLQLATLVDGIDRNRCYRFLNKVLHTLNDFVFE